MPQDINIGYPARTNITGDVQRFESENLERFSYVSTVIIPATLQFAIFNTDGTTLAPVAAQSGHTVTVSAVAANVGSVGLFYLDRQLPVSVGFYSYEWRAWGSSGASSGSLPSSLFVITRGSFEIAKTEPREFVSYGNKNNVLSVARIMVGRGDLTQRDIEPHMLGAYGYINGRLGKTITVPITPPPPVLARGEEVLTLYALHGTYRGSEKSELPPAIKQLRDDFVAYLDAVAAGEAIVTDSGVAFRIDDDITVITGGSEGGKPTFNKVSFESQRVDTDEIDNDEEE